MFIATVWYRNKNSAKHVQWVFNTAYRGADKFAIAKQAHIYASTQLPAYETQVLLSEVTHEVSPPEVSVELVPFKE